MKRFGCACEQGADDCSITHDLPTPCATPDCFRDAAEDSKWCEECRDENRRERWTYDTREEARGDR